MPSGPKLRLCVFIDGFGWELLRRVSFLDDILVTKAPLGTVLGYSSTCVPTILTGKLPREHGHQSFFYYRPEKSPFKSLKWLGFLPKWLTSRSRIRNALSRLLKKVYGFTGYFQIYNLPFSQAHLFDYSEKKDLFQSGGINGGVPTIFDSLRERRIPFHVSDWKAGEEENFRALEDSVSNGEVAFAYLILGNLDGIQHAHGTQSPLIAERVKWYEERLRRVLRSAQEKYGEVRLFMFSDHGMHDTTEDYDLAGRIDRLGLETGRDYAAVYDSTMARFWFFNEDSRKKVEAALQEEKRGRVLTDAELRAYGCDFPDRRYGELYFLMNPGILIGPSFMAERHVPGMHGYDPNDKDSLAMFASNVRPDPMPKRLDDLYALMLREAVG